MRILGIDPGSRFMGYGVVEGRRGRASHVGHGVIRVDPQAPLERRLGELHATLGQVLALYRPEAVAVEGVFTFKNARSALILGHARGVALLAATQAGLPVHEYAPARVKRSVGAGGAGGKGAVARMVALLLEMPQLLEERADASDALAIALCHLAQARPGVPAGPVRSRASGRRKGAFAALADRLQPAVRRPGGVR
ncbi:MAG: crossover junction endodeoxyribonuclease RuvC [Myxococcaceae bacterium]|nr:crossover junction endodeoxyribonuclease RuvC [Myxococcaceae bacterium]MCI0671740.1 crossover junction endodeoxyribonuclease RuvC [Myxococcaceae bacterium]